MTVVSCSFTVFYEFSFCHCCVFTGIRILKFYVVCELWQVPSFMSSIKWRSWQILCPTCNTCLINIFEWLHEITYESIHSKIFIRHVSHVGHGICHDLYLITKMDQIKCKTFRIAKETINKTKRQPSE